MHVDVSRGFIYFIRTSSMGEGGCATRLFIVIIFSCLVNHERD